MIQPITGNDYVCNRLIMPNFTQKPDVKLDKKPLKKVVKEFDFSHTISMPKLIFRDLISGTVKLLSGGKKELVYSEYTGNLLKICLYEKKGKSGKQIKQVKNLYHNGKMQSLEEYQDGKLVKTSMFLDDGKTLKFLMEYSEKSDYTKEFYNDGKSLKSFTLDKGSETHRFEYDKTGRMTSEAHFEDDIIQTKNIYDIKGKMITKNNYKDGKLVYSSVVHQSGGINYREISYDENENVKQVKIFYREPGKYAEADYDGDIRTIRRYVNGELKLTEIIDRKTNEIKRVYPSKKASNVKKS